MTQTTKFTIRRTCQGWLLTSPGDWRTRYSWFCPSFEVAIRRMDRVIRDGFIREARA